jgi:hypothetical protein
MKKNAGSINEFENFDQTMRKLMQVSHSEIKAVLDAEKTEKNKRPKKKGRPFGSGRASKGERKNETRRP